MPENNKDKENAVEKKQGTEIFRCAEHEKTGLDTVCRGAMGRVETLVVAAKELDDSAYQQQAQEMASSILRRSGQVGSYALGWKKAP